SNDTHNDYDKNVGNHDSESKYTEPKDFESENPNSFNNTHASKRVSATSSKKQTFLLKHNKPLNDKNKNNRSYNPEDYTNEDFDSVNRSLLKNNIEDALVLDKDALVLDYNDVLNPAAAYIAERQKLLKIANQMAQYNGLTKSDNKENIDVLTQQVRVQHLTKAIIYKCVKLCFLLRKFSHKDISVLKLAANRAFQSYRDAL
ncbi:17490_t:CDS:2, partial [Dentiscutata erythropus]